MGDSLTNPQQKEMTFKKRASSIASTKLAENQNLARHRLAIDAAIGLTI